MLYSCSLGQRIDSTIVLFTAMTPLLSRTTQMVEKQRLNLTVDADIPAILERMANGRNKMGEYLSQLIRSMDQGTPTSEIERADKESLRLMIQGLAGRVNMLEAEVISLQTKVAALLADRGAAARP